MTVLKCVLLAGLSILAVAETALAEKTCYKVDSMRYQNNGAYNVEKFYVMYKDENGKKKSTVGLENKVYPSQTGLVHIDVEIDLPDGTEVWGKIKIESGENEGCRKDGTKFYYYTKGGTVGYKSEGTTYNNNRCQLSSRPSDDYLIDCP